MKTRKNWILALESDLSLLNRLILRFQEIIDTYSLDDESNNFLKSKIIEFEFDILMIELWLKKLNEY